MTATKVELALQFRFTSTNRVILVQNCHGSALRRVNFMKTMVHSVKNRSDPLFSSSVIKVKLFRGKIHYGFIVTSIKF